MIAHIGGRKCKVNASLKDNNDCYSDLFRLSIIITGNRYDNSNNGERFAFSLILPRNINKIKQYIDASIYLNVEFVGFVQTSCSQRHMKKFLLEHKNEIMHLAIKSYIYGIKKYGM